MTTPDTVPAPSPVTEEVAVPVAVPAALRASMHVLVAALLAFTAARAVLVDVPARPGVLVFTVVLAAVYALGPWWVGRSPRAATPWLVVLLVAWAVLLVLTPDAVYLAFPWSFLLLHLLPPRAGLIAVTVTTAVAVAGFAWHQHQLAVGTVIGPVLGAAVVVATVRGYQALQAESEQRRRLLVELARTRTELATAERLAGVTDERERLAREIHDTLAQGLSSIQLLLLAAHRHLDPDRTVDPERARTLVEQARRTAKDNLDEARRVVRALSPGSLAGATLTAALQRLCDTAAAGTGMEITFHQQGPVTAMATPVEVALLRIAQGALGNAEQHSGATRVGVTLTVMDTTITLDVVDDGVGFDPTSPPPGHGGFGLHSMRSRTDEIGGALSIESHPGGGTAVSVHLDRDRAAAVPAGTR
jgi:signal transduction histidine kinase